MAEPIECDICERTIDDYWEAHWWDSPKGRVCICPRCFKLLGGWKGIFRKLATKGEFEDAVEFLRELARRGALE